MALLEHSGVTLKLERLLVSKKDLKALGIPYSAGHIARLEKEGKFPKRIPLGACRVAWRYQDICGWIEERAAKRGGVE